MVSKHEKNGTPKLAQSDVRAIFECLHNNGPVPTHLKFSIVPVGPTGQRFSPPSYEFEDGLYVLLKPMKKPKKKDAAWTPPKQPPDQLKHLIWTELPPENCPWSLSGPQFPNQRGTAIQQRYCYPGGNPDYSMFKGGAIWTMYYEDGKEAEDFRLLHVYYSNKRASNRKAKTTKRRKTTTNFLTPPRSIASTTSHTTLSSMAASPATSSLSARSPTISNDTDSTTILESPMPRIRDDSSALSVFWPEEQPIVTPINDILQRSPIAGMKQEDDEISSLPSPSVGYSQPSPFRRRSHLGFGINLQSSPLQRTGEYNSLFPDDNDGSCDYIPPSDDLRSILTAPIMSYDDDDDSYVSGLEGFHDDIRSTVLADSIDRPKGTEAEPSPKFDVEKLEEV